MTRFALLTLGLVACTADANVLSYEEFRAQAYREPDTGAYIVNGDELVEDEAAMRVAYDDFLASVDDADEREAGLGETEQSLAVNLVNGRDDRWPATTAQNLTYCVDKHSFGTKYTTVVAAVGAAADAWEAWANVRFVHVPALDGNCSVRTNVVFNVRQVRTGGQYLARAFFPSTSRRGRELLVDATSFGAIAPWSLTGIMRHELGHALGFRHEHTRPESGTCFENTQWRALTAYDRASVMHYPHCNGSQTGDLVITSSDRLGATKLYPF